MEPGSWGTRLGKCVFAHPCKYHLRLHASKWRGRNMLIPVFLFLAVAFLAYSNGANDNFKGVAALYGSCIASYRKALAWATATTGAGSVAALFLAAELLKKFSGKGLVPDALTASPAFLFAV